MNGNAAYWVGSGRNTLTVRGETESRRASGGSWPTIADTHAILRKAPSSNLNFVYWVNPKCTLDQHPKFSPIFAYGGYTNANNNVSGCP
jgi:hypothetical protein